MNTCAYTRYLGYLTPVKKVFLTFSSDWSHMLNKFLHLTVWKKRIFILINFVWKKRNARKHKLFENAKKIWPFVTFFEFSKIGHVNESLGEVQILSLLNRFYSRIHLTFLFNIWRARLPIFLFFYIFENLYTLSLPLNTSFNLFFLLTLIFSQYKRSPFSVSTSTIIEP